MTKAKVTFGREDVEKVFEGESNDRTRIKRNSIIYRNKNIIDAFRDAYGVSTPSYSKSQMKAYDAIVVLQLGKIYEGTVTNITEKGIISLTANGVKDEIICKESFADCLTEVRSYLLSHNNKILFEVRELGKGKAVVSIVNAYYRKWVESIEDSIKRENAIMVHIDKLVNGGYVAHTVIDTLYELTGKPYTSAVFIPGSHIVLNIETDFEKWVGENVYIVPQKFGDFKQNGKPMEKSLVGSRKRTLQIMGGNNLYELYTKYQLLKKNNPNSKTETSAIEGTVTGIINSSKRTGIFVELNDQYITGLMPTKANELLNYKPGDPIYVKIKEFEGIPNVEPFYFNKKGTRVTKCNVRPVFELA